MPYQYCHQCNIVWVFLAILIASCVVAIFHANRVNTDQAIWPIRVFKLIIYTWVTHAIEKATRDDLKKYSWRERFLAAWVAWISIIGIVGYGGVLKMLTMVGVITII